MKETLQAFLKEISLFSGLSNEELDILAQVATVVKYPRNAHIVREGDPGGSLLIVASGEVQIILERPAGDAVPLATFRRGDFFGELSLFDGKPRSATAVAVVDADVVEIDAQAFVRQIAQTPQVALKILAEIASRVRRTDETVRELADRVYREAHAALQASVAVELDSIKTIYQKTEERAAQTLERAAQTVGHIERLWALFLRGVPVVGLGLVVLTFFGVKSFNDFTAKVGEVNRWHQAIAEKEKEVQGIHARMQSAAKSLRIVKETMTDLRGLREDAGLGQRIETPDDLRRVALNYEQAKRQVLQRYISRPDAGAQYDHFEPEVVLEAVDTYVALAKGAHRDGRPVWGAQDPTEEVLSALLFVLRNLAASDDPENPGRVDWLEDDKLREMFRLVGAGVEERQRKTAVEALKKIVRDSRHARIRENAALILAEFEEKDDEAVGILKKMMEEENRPWRAAASAIGLARLSDVSGWRHIARQLKAGRGVYPAAMLLARQERRGLEQLAAKVGQAAAVEQLAQDVKEVITNRKPRNCFEERYARHLVACLDGDCRGGTSSGAVGGECTIGQ